MQQGRNVTTTMKRTANTTIPENDSGRQVVAHRIYLQQQRQLQQQQQQQYQQQQHQQQHKQRPMFDYEFWKNPEESTELHFLMPNGVMITMCMPIHVTLEELKTDVWEEAERYPLYCLLGDKNKYCFSTLASGRTNCNTTHENEATRLMDVQPALGIMRFVEKSNVSENTKLMENINILLDGKLPVKTLVNPEVNDFRAKMSMLSEEIGSRRQVMTRMERIAYQYPAKLVSGLHVPEQINRRLANGDGNFCVVAISTDMQVTVKVPCRATPDEVLNRILEKKRISMKARMDNSTDFILKVCGREEYIYGAHPMICFQYVQDCLSRDETPTFVPRLVRSVEVFKSDIYDARDDFTQWSSTTTTTNTTSALVSTASSVSTMSLVSTASSTASSGTMGKHNSSIAGAINAYSNVGSIYGNQSQQSHTLRKVKYITSWEVSAKLQCTVHEIRGLNIESDKELGVQLGLFHGGKSLCKTVRTRMVNVNGGVAFWNETIFLDISVSNVPRMARLCLVVYENHRTAKGTGIRTRRTKDGLINPIAWVNTMVYDYKNQLKSDSVTLYTWGYEEDAQSEDILHPLGTVEPNPTRDNMVVSMLLSFGPYGPEGRIIVYPGEEELLSHAAKMSHRNEHLNRESAEDTRSIKAIMSAYMYNDRLNDIHEQDRNAIWAKRRDCMLQMPQGLPCLLYCVEWNNRDEVSEIVSLLQEWPKLLVERALELLDYAYADKYVRRYAVDCLRTIEDDELLLYLLQLVQALKHESYLNCDLVYFLLQRALHNQHIGHYLFWHLRSELSVPSVQVRFGLILEAYLLGSPEHVGVLLKQMQCLRYLQVCSDNVKKGSKEKGRALLMEQLAKEGHLTSDLISPLNPSFRCKSVRTERCKVMDSKMRPLWVVYENSDPNGDDIHMIFKNGDDLRQDMLTLQMLRIMDRIWKNHGLDFRMNPYSCISTDHKLGLIEVVLNAETIANIQKERGMFSATSPFKKGSLLAWLREHNNTDELLAKAIQEFTLSCAGYCVATYVLGVADRHSDNIMVKKTGQLFHIDFGHILGHFKEKFGFRRERVPFVLTHDFVYVINNGRTDREAQEFCHFQKLCEDAFLILRQHGCLILSLFSMMISTGLPELSSEKDLNYLRETLVLDKTEEEARTHFKHKFSEALANSWKTSLNWASHNFSKNNRQ
ncbi:phosphatidylinositol 4,5-bisphosphate 3-kinase catalytic subunit beta isoform [Anopheles funestus]|uniref:phosphatidylinositol 4,5-bisphosphate 3-kinase catalytic subunit beta isoform n=1 Tax=Anopheles funestus TaxID=62324 RepID=UPI0020C613A8|nr:phosphatidylinositol 4,5-bisphosphate 3-kinase catalytic subunit beta isoform [Anopheles funestus]XP_049283280.1 phosphatidylinositol 4,5-bisphosphate 3-kinase catalytic subunit beta isoform [Anopheles funestus]